MTKVVLGIDAAWTAHNASGVAAIVDRGAGWELVAAAASYVQFHRACGRNGGAEPAAAEELLASVQAVAGALPDIVAVDMPLAKGQITGRRVSDNLISSAYGGRGAGTHSPSAIRPGPIGKSLSDGFSALGYDLAVSAPTARAMIEVYPHPALIELSGAPRRLPYKIARARKYWPDADATGRKANILVQWTLILDLLKGRMSGLDVLKLPALGEPIARFKAFEDTLDAVICGWVGAMVIEGQAKSHGDEFSAVWVPMGSSGLLQRVAVGE